MVLSPLTADLGKPPAITKERTLSEPVHCKKRGLGMFFAGAGDTQTDHASKKKLTKKEKDRENQKKQAEFQRTMDNSISSAALFTGKHTRTVVKRIPENSALASFMAVTHSCLSCHLPVVGKSPLCNLCKADPKAAVEAKERVTRKLQESSVKLNKCASICEDCGKNNPKINVETCKNADCSNLWDKLMAKRDVLDAQKLASLAW